jgi:thiol-disulfide isomerase/thioredoxin
MTIRPRHAPVLALLLAACLGPAVGTAAELGEQPTLSVATLDGGRFDLAEQRGQWVVVNFWATWCPPCIKEIPDLTDFDARRDDARVIGLAFEEIEAADLSAFLEKHPAGYPIAHVDPYEPLADFAAPRGLPMTYLIDPEGRVAKKFLGPVTGKDLDAAIAAAAKGDG